MLDRRSFIQQVAATVPAVTVMTSLAKGAVNSQQTSQPAPARGANTPFTRRGFGGRGNVDPHFAGSPVGS